MKKMQITGTYAVLPRELTRAEVAKRLHPSVTVRQLQNYLNFARLYLKEFEEFTDELNGGLNRYAKLYEWHLPILQKIRDKALRMSSQQLAIELSKGQL
jgi:hypothetical protein